MAKLPYSVIVTLFFAIGIITPVFSQEDITITTYYPSPVGSYNELSVAHHLTAIGDNNDVADNKAMIYAQNTYPSTALGNSAIKGASLNAAVYGALGYYINGIPPQPVWQIGVYGVEDTPSVADTHYAAYFVGDVMVTGRLSASSCVNYLENSVTPCPAGSYAVGCGTGTCAAPGVVNSPDNCPGSGYMICVRHN